MQNKSRLEGRTGLLMTIFALAVVTTLAVLPTQLQWEVNSQGKGLIERTETHDPELPDYDIREALTKEPDNFLMKIREENQRTAASIADIRDEFVRGEESLRSRVPTLKIEYSKILGVPELIAPDPLKGRAVMSASTNDRVGTLREFIKENSSLVGLPHDQLDALKVQTDFVNKVGGIGLVILEQQINDIPVFRGELAGHFSNEGELFRVTNNLASGLDYGSLSRDFGDPANAVRIAAENVGAKVDLTLNAARSTDSKVYFGEGHYPASAWKYYFPIEPGVVRAAWYVNVWKPVTAYEMFIDAETGKILWRTNMGKDQTQSVTYNVWTNSTSFVQSMDSPAPLSPGPIDPSLGTQGTLQPRTMVTLIGNEAPNQFNNNGWITDGNNTISGNNTHAGLDRFSPNGVDDPLIAGSANRVFDFAANPAPGNPAPGDPSIPVGTTINPCSATVQVPVDIQRAAAVQMFYVVNRLHDVLYRHGFTEQTRNFQVDNFGRGGTGGDPVLSEGQDCSGVNNANMASSTTDGTTARMQMFLWNTSSPTRDGTWDADIVLHEIGHGVVNRNHINGISGTQGGQMHEGNGDFQAHLLLAESSDPINGTYTTGGYSTLGLRPGPPFSSVGNYYYGIRRFPKAVIAFTGGPGNLPHNPMTYADIDPAQMSLTDGAFAPAFPGSATAVHDGGEIWSSMLWEVRSRMVQRLGHEAGTSKMLQLWMDSMRATTSSTSMLNSRNAMVQVAQNTGTAADVADVWAGFAVRGLGFNAANPSGNTVIEDFGLPNATIVDPFTVTENPGDGDGFPEPGEDVLLHVSVTNNTGSTVNNVSVAVAGGGSVSYGNVAHGVTVSNPIPYTIPADAPCGSLHEVSLTLTSDLATNPVETRDFRLGVPVGGAPASFTNSTPINMPAGQPGTTAGPFSPYPSDIAVSGLSGQKVIRVKLNGFHHEWYNDVDLLLVGPGGQKYIFMSDNGNNNTELLPPITFSIVDTAADLLPGTNTGVIADGGEYRPSNVGANDPFDAPAPPAPYENAAPGGAATFASVFGTDGAAMNGTWSLYGDDDAASDPGVIDGGWTITFESNEYACGVGTPTPTPTPIGTPTPTPTPTATPTPTPTPTPGPSNFIYDNGGLSTGPTTNSGVAAPAGTTWSEVQNETGNTTVSNTLAGVSCSLTGTLFRCADDFVVPAGQTWTLDQVAVFVYQTGFAGTTSPVAAGTLQIWNGRPGDVGATVIFGDTTTNRLSTSTDSLMWRTFNTTVPPPGTPPATNRRIWDTRLTVAPAQVLAAGTYWIDWQTQIGTTTAHFAPNVTIPGIRGRAGDNARQFTATGWVDVLDTGNPITPPSVPQDFPFKIVGTIEGGPTPTPTPTPTETPTPTPTPTPGGGTTFPGTGTGSIPDGTVCGTEGTPLVVSFNVTGITPAPTNVSVAMTGTHTWVGDMSARLVAPNGTTHVVFGKTGSTTTGGVGDNSDFAGPYTFDDAAAGNWWTAATTAGPLVPVAAGPYRTSTIGGAAGGGTVTLMTAAFAGIPTSNGTWTMTFTDQCPADLGSITAASLTLSGGVTPPSGNGRADFDGDGRTDISVFRPSEGIWYVDRSTDGFLAVNWGLATDTPVPADYDGDGLDDVAVFRADANGVNPDFIILNSSNSTVTGLSWGLPGDVPAIADYDGDGLDDVAVFRPSDSTWYILLSSDSSNVIFSNPGTTPVPGDYDGDGEADGIIFTNGTWTGALSGGGSANVNHGQAGDIPVSGYYDGDALVDYAVFRPSDGTWHILRSSDGQVVSIPFGVSTDIPVPGDYDGDGHDDQAIYRNGQWWINGSTSGVSVHSFGLATDAPVPAAARP